MASRIIRVVDELTNELTVPSEEEVFKEGIEKRNNFSQFILENVNSVLTTHLQKTINSIKDKTSSTTIIGGSRSWDKYFNKDLCNQNITVKSLNSIENASIVPGNFDIFCFCSDKSQIDSIIHQMCICFDKIVEELNSSKIGEYFELHWDNNGNIKRKVKTSSSLQKSKFIYPNLEEDCPINVEPNTEGCVFPACNSIDLELMFSPHPDLPKNAKGIIKKGTKVAYNLKDFDRKVLIYFEIILVESEIILDDIQKYLINPRCNKDKKDTFNYLNLEGLYLFSELIVKRGDKDYDVDLYRKKILDKVVEENNLNIKDFYRRVLDIYKFIFKSRTDYQIKFNWLLKKYINILNKDLLNDYASNITEAVRPYINSFVSKLTDTLYTDKVINKNVYHSQNAYVFITGGDAYRRYIKDIRKTNDIDTKIIYKNKEDEPILIDIAIEQLSGLISALYNNKFKIFDGLDITLQLTNDMTLNFRPEYLGGQFRLRMIKTQSLNLLSIDYRYKLSIEFNKKEIYVMNNEVAILDVVLQHDETGQYEYFKNKNVYMSSGLPVASVYYLTNDLKKMYKQINENLRSRYHKSTKDKDRFMKIVKFIKDNTNSSNESKSIKRKIDELPDVDISEILHPKKKKIITPIKYNFNTPTPINYLFNVEMISSGLDKRFRSLAYTDTMKSAYTYINRYKQLFLHVYNKESSSNPDIEKVYLQFNDIMDIYKPFYERLKNEDEDDDEDEDEDDNEEYEDDIESIHELSDMDIDENTQSDLDNLTERLAKINV